LKKMKKLEPQAMQPRLGWLSLGVLKGIVTRAKGMAAGQFGFCRKIAKEENFVRPT
jgi:hypothetical protein